MVQNEIPGTPQSWKLVVKMVPFITSSPSSSYPSPPFLLTIVAAISHNIFQDFVPFDV